MYKRQQQLRFAEVDGTIVFFNEAEAVCDLEAPEPETLEPALERRKKATGKDVYKRQLYHSKWSFRNGYEPFYSTTINYN